jgi:magnesium transporter
MLSVYVPHGSSLERVPMANGAQVPDAAIWFDLIQPTQAEDKLVESVVGISVPTREEMQEIEVTSRLYVENGARYMTATLMCQSDTDTPKTTAVTFILSGHRLITVRYDEPRPFMIVGHKLARLCPAGINGESVLMELLDAVIDRAADILERIGVEVDRVSHDIFEPETGETRSSPGDPEVDRPQGRPDVEGSREPRFRSGVCCCTWPTKPTACAGRRSRARSCAACSATSIAVRPRHLSLQQDHSSCSMPCSVSSRSSRTTSSRSSRSRRLCSCRRPLVASIYGMNFKHMPELDWQLGYPLAIVLMLIAAALPYVFFKWKNWL